MHFLHSQPPASLLHGGYHCFPFMKQHMMDQLALTVMSSSKWDPSCCFNYPDSQNFFHIQGINYIRHTKRIWRSYRFHIDFKALGVLKPSGLPAQCTIGDFSRWHGSLERKCTIVHFGHFGLMLYYKRIQKIQNTEYFPQVQELEEIIIINKNYCSAFCDSTCFPVSPFLKSEWVCQAWSYEPSGLLTRRKM